MSVERITTVLVAATAMAPAPASPYDLTDLATVRDELSIPSTDTSSNAFLQRGITQVSKAIARYCNRVFPVEAVQDLIYIQQDPYPWQVPGGVYGLQLSRWPLANANVVAFAGNTHGSRVIDGIASTAGIACGALIFAVDGSVPVGTRVCQVFPQSLLLTQAATSNETGLAFTTGVQVIQTLSEGVTQTLTYGKDYTVDARKGWLVRLDSWTGVSQKWEAWPTTVQYQGGYSDIPDDLVDACLQLITGRYRARGRDPMLVERSQPGLVGTERYWVGSQAGQTGAFPPQIEALLEPYRVPVAL